jgi:hypothetical protein
MTIKPQDWDDFHTEVDVKAADHESRIHVRLTRSNGPIPPVVLQVESGAFSFLEFLTPEEAVELARALQSASLRARFPGDYGRPLSIVPPEDGAA